MKECAAAAMFVLGVVLASCECDPPWWPWINFAGLFIFATTGLIVIKKAGHRNEYL
jgi:hypothetical protein